MNIEYKAIHDFCCDELERLFLSVEWSSGHYPDNLWLQCKILIQFIPLGIKINLSEWYVQWMTE